MRLIGSAYQLMLILITFVFATNALANESLDISSEFDNGNEFNHFLPSLPDLLEQYQRIINKAEAIDEQMPSEQQMAIAQEIRQELVDFEKHSKVILEDLDKYLKNPKVAEVYLAANVDSAAYSSCFKKVLEIINKGENVPDSLRQDYAKCQIELKEISDKFDAFIKSVDLKLEGLRKETKDLEKRLEDDVLTPEERKQIEDRIRANNEEEKKLEEQRQIAEDAKSSIDIFELFKALAAIAGGVAAIYSGNYLTGASMILGGLAQLKEIFEPEPNPNPSPSEDSNESKGKNPGIKNVLDGEEVEYDKIDKTNVKGNPIKTEEKGSILVTFERSNEITYIHFYSAKSGELLSSLSESNINNANSINFQFNDIIKITQITRIQVEDTHWYEISAELTSGSQVKFACRFFPLVDGTKYIIEKI